MCSDIYHGQVALAGMLLLGPGLSPQGNLPPSRTTLAPWLLLRQTQSSIFPSRATHYWYYV